MPTLNQLIRNPRVPKREQKLSALVFKSNKSGKVIFCPQKGGTCKKVGILKPKKPNSANRAWARIRLKNGEEITVHIPGEKHGIAEYSYVLVKGGGAQDVPGSSYDVVRGYKEGNAEGVKERKQGRSLYGTKKPKNDSK